MNHELITAAVGLVLGSAAYLWGKQLVKDVRTWRKDEFKAASDWWYSQDRGNGSPGLATRAERLLKGNWDSHFTRKGFERLLDRAARDLDKPMGLDEVHRLRIAELEADLERVCFQLVNAQQAVDVHSARANRAEAANASFGASKRIAQPVEPVNPATSNPLVRKGLSSLRASYPTQANITLRTAQVVHASGPYLTIKETGNLMTTGEPLERVFTVYDPTGKVGQCFVDESERDGEMDRETALSLLDYKGSKVSGPFHF